MLKRLLPLSLITSLFITSCKKDSDTGGGGSDSHTIVVNATAATTLRVNISVNRMIDATNGTMIEYVDLYGIVNPYTFTSNKAKKGDEVAIYISTAKNQTIDATVKFDGRDLPYSSFSSNSGDKAYKQCIYCPVVKQRFIIPVSR